MRALAILIVVGACQSHSSTDTPPAGSAAPRADAVVVAADAAVAMGSDDLGSAKPKPDEPELPADPSKLIAELGAIPAWQAVIDRATLLARRDQHGVVYGLYAGPVMVAAPVDPNAVADAGVGPHVDAGLVPSKYGWLVDDTEGNGSLAIRVDLAGKQVAPGDRVAFGGAWVLDDARTWVWKVDAVSPLPPGAPSGLKEAPALPGHVIVDGGLPPGGKMISFAKDDDAVIFQLVGPPPASDGDGWPVGDELGSPVAALLNLPGERASYGAQDMRTPDEHWTLKRGQTYWVRIGKLHKRGDKLTVMNARTAPVRIK